MQIRLAAYANISAIAATRPNNRLRSLIGRDRTLPALFKARLHSWGMRESDLFVVSLHIKKQTVASASLLDLLPLVEVVNFVVVEKYVRHSDNPHSLQPLVPFIAFHFAVVVLQFVHHASL